MKILVLLATILSSQAVLANPTCFTAEGTHEASFCIEQITYDAYEQNSKKNALIVTGHEIGGVFTVIKSEYLSDQTVLYTGTQNETWREDKSCGAVSWTSTTISAAYDFMTAIDVSRVLITREITSTSDSCHIQPTKKTLTYQVLN